MPDRGIPLTVIPYRRRRSLSRHPGPRNSLTVIPDPHVAAKVLRQNSYWQPDHHRREHLPAARATASPCNYDTSSLASLRLSPALMEAGNACSLGSMSHVLYDVGGEYRRNM
jgi:hypothetical protein